MTASDRRTSRTRPPRTPPSSHARGFRLERSGKKSPGSGAVVDGDGGRRVECGRRPPTLDRGPDADRLLFLYRRKADPTSPSSTPKVCGVGLYRCPELPHRLPETSRSFSSLHVPLLFRSVLGEWMTLVPGTPTVREPLPCSQTQFFRRSVCICGGTEVLLTTPVFVVANSWVVGPQVTPPVSRGSVRDEDFECGSSGLPVRLSRRNRVHGPWSLEY